MGKYADFYRRSLDDKAGFWAEQAQLIDWQTPFEQVLDDSKLPFARWFVGGKTNLCYNAVDRHLKDRAEQKAITYLSTETGKQGSYTFRELHAEVNRVAAMLMELGVGQGDRVIIYMPMVAEAVFAMLACVRIGAIHSVVFGGFAAHSLATRIDDALPKVLITADAGMRGGKQINYKPLVDEAVSLAKNPPAKVLLFKRGLDADMAWNPARDVDWETLTTGKPKGVQRDTGGYAVALAAA
jgi:propionyl-CoA synthetase